MHKVALLTCLSLFAFNAMADVLHCEDLKARVDAKLQAKGVPSYTLEIVPMEGSSTAAASGVPAPASIKGKEVGTCDGGTKRLIYTRGN